MRRNLIWLYVAGKIVERFGCFNRRGRGCDKCGVRFECYTTKEDVELQLGMTYGEYKIWDAGPHKVPKRSSSYYRYF